MLELGAWSYFFEAGLIFGTGRVLRDSNSRLCAAKAGSVSPLPAFTRLEISSMPVLGSPAWPHLYHDVMKDHTSWIDRRGFHDWVPAVCQL